MMKKMLCLLLALLMTLSFACAEELRGYTKTDGYVYLTLGTFPQTVTGDELPILWRVLSVEAGRAYLLSEYILEARPIHSDYKEYANKPTHKTKPGFNGDYAKTEMALYLNGDFMAHFTQGELEIIAPDEAYGSFFLVAADDLKNKAYGFDSNESRKAWGTDYAKENGLFVYMANRGSHSPYWTRTQSTSNQQGARCIKSKGELGYINVITEDEGMRPACYLDMSKAVIGSGRGTKDDPYVLKTGEPILADPVTTPEPEPEITEVPPMEDTNE